ncbi:hypothetical protein MBLNU459_g2451t1 [Dothideomycetes sp. NU459]
MVSLKDVQASNSLIPSTLPAGLVAVFVGATNGIGEATLKQFALYTRQPRVYFIGRSQAAGDRIAAECKSLNADGDFIFIKADTSLLRNVDEICLDIKKKETAINLLFLSTGTLDFVSETKEGLLLATSLGYYARTRFIVNLLPLLQRATSLRRVVSVFAGTKEGRMNTDDFMGRTLSARADKNQVGLRGARGHAASLASLSLRALAATALGVAFVHDFPGWVKSGIGRDAKGAVMRAACLVAKLVGPLFYIATKESGERHLFCATSARWPVAKGRDDVSMVPLVGEVGVARGLDGKYGSGMYSIDWDGESAGAEAEEVISRMEKDGIVEKLWAHTEEEFVRITGSKCV